MSGVPDPILELPAMQIRCPHCHHPIEVVDEQLFDELTCPFLRQQHHAREPGHDRGP
jgi:hypothetical protein